MKKLILTGSFAISVWDLLVQIPATEFLAVVLLICVLTLVVLFYEPACSRLIRIIRAFAEVKRSRKR